jgi:dipeptidyl aminopeptidase/acylaminoacyl peptidase
MDLYEKASDGTGDEQLLLASEEPKAASDWSADGRFLAYITFSLRTQADLWVLPLAGERKPFGILRTDSNENDAHFSPDGRWLAYISNESGPHQMYVRPFSATAPTTPGGQWQISTGGGTRPRWRRDGKELFYIANDNRLMAVAVKTDARFEAGPPRPLFETHIFRGFVPNFNTPYAVTADGQRFLVLTAVEEPKSTPVTVVLNWTAGIKK